MSSEPRSLRGKVEYHDDRLIKGWALNPASPLRPVSLQVVAEDRVLQEFEPTIYRADLRHQGVEAGHFGFVSTVPPALATSASVALHLRFATTGRELEGSPVKVGSHYESQRVPFQTSDLTGHRVLVLSPHPDDESLACGGAIILHRDAGDPVKIVFLTDGSRAVRAEGTTVADYVSLRRREAAAAASVLGTTDLEFWDHPDRELAAAPDVGDRLSQLVSTYRPTLIYAPSPLEFHPDHRATAEILWAAIAHANCRCQVAFYDFNRPIRVNALVDITGVLARKREACDAYRSQLAIHPYTEAALSLNRYRALTVSADVEHAEGYFVTPSNEIIGRPVDSFAVRQFKPPARERLETEPLVSVIVRTKDRPVLLRDALSSVLTQSYSNIEIVLVNDGGVDVSEIAEEFEPYIAISQRCLADSVGRVAAANVGLRMARGKYLNFLDDDDVLYPTHLSKLVTYLETTGERLAYSDCEKVRYGWDGTEIQQWSDKIPDCRVDFDRERLFHSNYIPFMTAVFRRDLAEEIGPFDEELEVLEDWDYWIRASQVTDFVRLPGVTAEYRVFAEHDYMPNTVEVRRKHSHLWMASRRVQKEADLLNQVVSLQQQLEQAREEFRMVTESHSWRLTRMIPSPLRRFLRWSLRQRRA